MALADIIAGAAAKYGVPPSIMQAVATQESGLNATPPDGAAGEIGTFQVMPANIAAAGYTASQARDPTTNANIAGNMLASLYDKYGSWTAALSAYNTGSPTSATGATYAASVLTIANGGSTGVGSMNATSSLPATTGTGTGTTVASSPGGTSTPATAGTASSSAASTRVLAYLVAALVVLALLWGGISGTVKT